MIAAVDATARAHYVSSYGLVSYNLSQFGMSVQMTDLAQGRKLVAEVRAGHPEWDGVPVALIKVPYTEKRLRAVQAAVPEAFYRTYQLVGIGFENCRHLLITSSDTRLKGSAGSAGRERLARIFEHAVGVRVVVAYSTPSTTAAG